MPTLWISIEEKEMKKERFCHVLGDIPHWICKCSQPNAKYRGFCLYCHDPQPEGLFTKTDYPNKGRLGGR